MNPKQFSTKLGYTVVASILLGIFAFTHISHEQSPAQSAYENWLNGFLPKLQNPKINNESPPPIALSLSSQSLGIQWNMKLEPDKNTEKVTRLLEMFKESKLLEVQSSVAPDMTLEVNDGSNRFAAAFSPKDIEENSQAQSMLKLFQIYATGVTQ